MYRNRPRRDRATLLRWLKLHFGGGSTSIAYFQRLPMRLISQSQQFPNIGDTRSPPQLNSQLETLRDESLTFEGRPDRPQIDRNACPRSARHYRTRLMSNTIKM